MVSEAWRELNPEDKEEWEAKARKDKARYEVEKAMYKGPWKVPANKRTPKDPSAPKRPMSAFLAFSNKRRAALKRQHPDATNADLSKMLSKTWKEAEQPLRQKYMDEEAGLRAHYKVEMGKWRKRVAEEKRVERKEREALAMQAAENRTAEQIKAQNEAAAAAASNQESMQQGYPGMYGVPPFGYPHQGQMGEMGQHQGGYPNMMGGGPFMPQMGAQQQLLTQLLAGQQMNQFMPGGRPPMGGMYGQQQGGGQQGGPPGPMPPNGGQHPPPGNYMPPMGGPQGMGSAGGNFGMDSNMQQGNPGEDQGGEHPPQGQQQQQPNQYNGNMPPYHGQPGYGAPPPGNGYPHMNESGAAGSGGEDGFQRANL